MFGSLMVSSSRPLVHILALVGPAAALAYWLTRLLFLECCTDWFTFNKGLAIRPPLAESPVIPSSALAAADTLFLSWLSANPSPSFSLPETVFLLAECGSIAKEVPLLVPLNLT